MGKIDFITETRGYIDSFIDSGYAGTEEEWKECIKKEQENLRKDYPEIEQEEFDDMQIGWIIEELEKAGLVNEDTQKYIVIDSVGADTFEKAFDNKMEAIDYARSEWDSLSDFDKSKRSAYYVLESVDPEDKEGKFYDGDIILDLMKEDE